MSNIGKDRRDAWRAALACMVTLAVAMGLGRFAFTGDLNEVIPKMIKYYKQNSK